MFKNKLFTTLMVLAMLLVAVFPVAAAPLHDEPLPPVDTAAPAVVEVVKTIGEMTPAELFELFKNWMASFMPTTAVTTFFSKIETPSMPPALDVDIAVLTPMTQTEVSDVPMWNLWRSDGDSPYSANWNYQIISGTDTTGVTTYTLEVQASMVTISNTWTSPGVFANASIVDYAVGEETRTQYQAYLFRWDGKKWEQNIASSESLPEPLEVSFPAADVAETKQVAYYAMAVPSFSQEDIFYFTWTGTEWAEMDSFVATDEPTLDGRVEQAVFTPITAPDMVEVVGEWTSWFEGIWRGATAIVTETLGAGEVSTTTYEVRLAYVGGKLYARATYQDAYGDTFYMPVNLTLDGELVETYAGSILYPAFEVKNPGIVEVVPYWAFNTEMMEALPKETVEAMAAEFSMAAAETVPEAGTLFIYEVDPAVGFVSGE